MSDSDSTNERALIQALARMLSDVRACCLCAAALPLGPRPVLRLSTTARLLIIGQAPGIRVHETGIPWNDPSGNRLRQWLALDQTVFYDENRIAIMPMGFCYPGTDAQGGDRPPRRECAPAWHAGLRRLLPAIRLTLLVGRYAQLAYLGRRCRKGMSETVAAWQEYGPEFLPLPHPSWRNTVWLKRHPWFESDLVPTLRQRVASVLDDVPLP